jgi:hypothetical protein
MNFILLQFVVYYYTIVCTVQYILYCTVQLFSTVVKFVIFCKIWVYIIITI